MIFKIMVVFLLALILCELGNIEGRMVDEARQPHHTSSAWRTTT